MHKHIDDEKVATQALNGSTVNFYELVDVSHGAHRLCGSKSTDKLLGLPRWSDPETVFEARVKSGRQSLALTDSVSSRRSQTVRHSTFASTMLLT